MSLTPEEHERTIQRMETYDGLPDAWRGLVADYGLAIVLHLYNECEDYATAVGWLMMHKGKPVRRCKSGRRRI